LIAALGWGTHDLLVRTIAPGARVLPQLAVVMLVAALVTAPFGWTRALPDLETLALAIASGCTYFGASLALYAAFARAPVKLVAPVIGAYPLPALGYELLRGNPVIVRLRYPNGITHFVVIVGKRGHEYLIRDPSGRYQDGLYFLSEFGSPIEALRFYRKLERPPAENQQTYL
jgi:hypothetical protein